MPLAFSVPRVPLQISVLSFFYHLFSILKLFVCSYILLIFPWKPCHATAHLCHPLLSFFFRCLHVGFKTRMHHRFMEKTIIVCSLVLSYQILFSFLIVFLIAPEDWDWTHRHRRANHSDPKVSFSSGKSCMKGPCPCFISYILQVNLASVHY